MENGPFSDFTAKKTEQRMKERENLTNYFPRFHGKHYARLNKEYTDSGADRQMTFEEYVKERLEGRLIPGTLKKDNPFPELKQLKQQDINGREDFKNRGMDFILAQNIKDGVHNQMLRKVSLHCFDVCVEQPTERFHAIEALCLDRCLDKFYSAFSAYVEGRNELLAEYNEAARYADLYEDEDEE
eukprot:TRINITY_DN12510_c0_g1_i1.p1 TRINITY_DN12510_c0_g1~~TRINITY_DN12510_c0_g1_i1.p1  ORF type:complete len:185 (-),score=47.93 TRINITY_DN12510_c0_g1_i1:156-710(-)